MFNVITDENYVCYMGHVKVKSFIMLKFFISDVFKKNLEDLSFGEGGHELHTKMHVMIVFFTDGQIWSRFLGGGQKKKKGKKRKLHFYRCLNDQIIIV